MSIETDADRLVFLSPAEFGVSVIYNDGTLEAAIPAIFSDQFASSGFDLDVDVASYDAVFTVRTSDAPNAARGQTLVVDGLTYVIDVIERGATGFTKIGATKE